MPSGDAIASTPVVKLGLFGHLTRGNGNSPSWGIMHVMWVAAKQVAVATLARVQPVFQHAARHCPMTGILGQDKIGTGASSALLALCCGLARFETTLPDNFAGSPALR